MCCHEELKPRVYETPRPMQACVSCSGCRTTACDPHALSADQCGEHVAPTLSTAQQQRRGSCVRGTVLRMAMTQNEGGLDQCQGHQYRRGPVLWHAQLPSGQLCEGKQDARWWITAVSRC